MPPFAPEDHLWFTENLYPHEPFLRAWLNKRFPELPDIDDIIQEAYLKVYLAHRKRPILRPKSYLFATARNLSINALRSAKVRYENVLVKSEFDNVKDNGMELFDIVQRESDLELLTRAIQSLPNKCRRIFTLRKVYGLSQKEIAEQLGLSVHTVYTQVAIGLQKCSEYVRRERGEIKYGNGRHQKTR
ncbi:MAG: RNA polymerase sigma factor [Puniceicoccaceae bacterium]